jgi:hypothetical protein
VIWSAAAEERRRCAWLVQEPETRAGNDIRGRRINIQVNFDAVLIRRMVSARAPAKFTMPRSVVPA